MDTLMQNSHVAAEAAREAADEADIILAALAALLDRAEAAGCLLAVRTAAEDRHRDVLRKRDAAGN